jgi:hypothetical protein
MSRVLAMTMMALLSGCSWSGSLGPIGPAAPIVVPPGDKVVEPNGEVIEPAVAPIDTVIHGLAQAQTTRVLVRQLSRP